MGFRFRRTVEILPGLRLNFGKTGVSVSAGVPGANITIGGRGVTTSAGLPGTGLHWTQLHSWGAAEEVEPADRLKLLDLLERSKTVDVVVHDEDGFAEPPAPLFTVLTLVKCGLLPEDIQISEDATGERRPVPAVLLSFLRSLGGNPTEEELRDRRAMRAAVLETRRAARKNGPKLAALTHAMETSVYWFQDDEVKGPLTLLQVVIAVTRGRVPYDTQVCEAGTETWQSIDPALIAAYLELEERAGGETA